jgi:hypothetical protein
VDHPAEPAGLARERAITAVQARVAEICGQLNVLHAQLAEVVQEALECELWVQPGVRSEQHWLAWQTGMSPGRAHQLLEAVHRAAELPVTFAAFAAGELSIDQVTAVARWTPAHNDREACELAKVSGPGQLRHALSRYVRRPAQPDEPDAPAAQPAAQDIAEREYLSGAFDDHGHYRLSGVLDADRGAVVHKALEESRDRLFHEGHRDVTWADALVDVCHRSLGAVRSPARRDRYRCYIHLATDTPNGDPVAWLNAGPALPDALRDLICCDSVAQPLFTAGGLPINQGRARYIVPERTRRQVLDRDRTCRYPGCSARTHLDIHHIVEFLRKGRTDLDNLLALCPAHHRGFHHRDYRITGNPNRPGQLHFHDHRGQPILAHAPPRPPTGPPPTPTRPYQHPTGEPINPRWLTFSDAS